MFFLCPTVRGGVCVYLEKERGFFVCFYFSEAGHGHGCCFVGWRAVDIISFFLFFWLVGWYHGLLVGYEGMDAVGVFAMCLRLVGM